MEKHKLILKNFITCLYVLIVTSVFLVSLPLAYSEVEYVKSEGHVMELRSKEPFEIRNGKIIYLEHCAPCHGETGKGNGNYYASGLEPRPRNFTDPEFMKQVQDDYLFDVITKGTAAFGMSPFCPPWGETLGEEEKIKNIISFLRTLVSKK